MRELPEAHVHYPSWVAPFVDWEAEHPTPEDRMRVAIDLARQNVEHGTGGPFGAAVFERESGRLVSVGMNLVVAHQNSALHAEMVALMMAEVHVGKYSLAAEGLPAHELATSCDPCAMCLGAILWSGVTRVICGANRDNAVRLGFDEGPVFEESYRYLESRMVEVMRGVLQHQAAEVLEDYRRRGGRIYNA
jgi:tRNA(Arg) A34 adenosine deaminase TadA